MNNLKQYMVMDIIHGGISLSADEVAVIDHILFQRLRFISQNDVLSLVFPGATHSRFEHSIGAMHMSGRFWDSIVSKGYYKATTDNQISGLSYLRQCLRLAVLLHDVGHGAFSHQLEKSEEIQKLFSQEGHFEKLWDSTGLDYSSYYSEIPEHVEHEHYSVAVAATILHDLEVSGKLSVNVSDVLAIMETTSDCKSDLLSKEFMMSASDAWGCVSCNVGSVDYVTQANQMRFFLRSILTNELDADKADYMLRDGQYSSVSYGNYNIDTLIDNLAAVYIENENKLRISLLRKGLSAFEDFTYSRFQLYRQIYSHKNAIMFNLILNRAIKEVMSVPEVYDRVKVSMSYVDQFAFVTDHFFYEEFRKYAMLNRNSYCYKLIYRNKLSFIKRMENISLDTINDVKLDLSKEVGVSVDSIFHYTTKAKFSAIDENFTGIRLIKNNNDTLEISLIHDETDFFNRFENITITNFYY